MAANEEEVRRAAIAELARRELARRQAAGQPALQLQQPQPQGHRYGGPLEEAAGLGEVALQAATGAVAQPIAGIAGLVAGAIPGGRPAADVVRGVQDAVTYDPKTYAGQRTGQAIAKPFQAFERFADWAGEASGAPEDTLGATAVKTAIMAAPMFLMGGTKKSTTAPGGAAQVLDDAGVPLTTAQRGGTTARTLAGSAGRAADTVLGPSQFGVRQIQGFTRALWDAFKHGAPTKLANQVDDAVKGASSASPDVMSRAMGVIQNSYDDLTARVPTAVDDAFVNQLDDVATTAVRELSDGDFKPINNQIENILSKVEGGSIPGQAAQNIRQSLQRVSGNPALKHWAEQIRHALDDAFERGAAPDDAAQMTWTRQRFQMLKQIEDAVSKNETGLVSPQRLFNAMSTKRNRGQMVYGRGEQSLANLARAGKEIIKDVPNSGTPQRLADIGRVAAILTNPVLAAKIGGGALAGRLLNENQALARALTKPSRLSPNPALAGALVVESASVPQKKRDQNNRQ